MKTGLVPVAVVASAVLGVIALGGSGSAVGGVKELRMDAGPLAPVVKVLSLPLAGDLTYQASDLGFEFDTVAKVLQYVPERGLCLIDPGPSSAKPTLQCYADSGAREALTPLAKALALADPAAFVAQALFVTPEGAATILYSTALDADTDLPKNFRLGSLSASGASVANSPLPGFKGADSVYRGADGKLWAYQRARKSGGWEVSSPPQAGALKLAAPKGAVLLPDGELLVLGKEGAATFQPDGKRTAVQGVAGAGRAGISDAAQVVSGPGYFFGALSVAASDGPHRLATLEVFHFRPDTRTLSKLGEQSVPWQELTTDGAGEISHYDFVDPKGWSVDAHGSFYYVARSGPAKPALTLYRMELRKEVREALRGR